MLPDQTKPDKFRTTQNVNDWEDANLGSQNSTAIGFLVVSDKMCVST